MKSNRDTFRLTDEQIKMIVRNAMMLMNERRSLLRAALKRDERALAAVVALGIRQGKIRRVA